MRLLCNYIVPSQMLPELLASGTVEELAEEQYRAALLPPDPAADMNEAAGL